MVTFRFNRKKYFGCFQMQNIIQYSVLVFSILKIVPAEVVSPRSQACENNRKNVIRKMG